MDRPPPSSFEPLIFTGSFIVRMQRILRALSTAVLSLFTAALFAQISFGGEALGLRKAGSLLPAAVQHVFPEVDAAAEIASDEARWSSGIKGPWRFGVNHVADLGTQNAGTWHVLRNGDRVWRTTLVCPGAFSINFRFDRYVVPEGGRVFVYNDHGQQLGAFTAASAPGRSFMGVTQLAGDRITVEYHEPAELAGQGELHIDQVTHAYRDVFRYAKDLGSSGSCNVNVICPEGDDWRDQIRSVAIITVGGSGFCTGTLVNNCAQDSTPYFLTANHCLDADVESWVFRFNWDSPTCTPTENGPTDQTVSGCELLVNSAGTDVAFLELSSIPPADYNVYWSGWDKSSTPAQSVVGIHHPAGDIKKISHSYDPVIQGTMSGADCWQVQVWDVGTTEPGSSGSGLWNQEKRLVGQLFGGEADCSNSVNDFYGRLDVSWPLLEPYLGSCGDVLDGWEPDGVVPVVLDAAVTSIQNVPELLCDEDRITPRVTLKNNGTTVVTIMTVTYGVVGEPQYTYAWTGSLQPGQTVNVDLPMITVPTGEHVLTVVVSAPNGTPDPVPTNDTWTFPFVVNSPGDEVIFALTLDNYGTDITWTLESAAGTLLYEGGPYEDFDEGEVIQVPFCLTNGCYTFTIDDVFGDGICCDEGNGSYVIYGPDSLILAESDGQYGSQNINEFCVEVVGIPERIDAGSLLLLPNPSVGPVTLRLSGISGTARWQLLDAAGRNILQGSILAGQQEHHIDLSGITSGIYLMQVVHAGGRLARSIVLQR